MIRKLNSIFGLYGIEKNLGQFLCLKLQVVVDITKTGT